MALPQRTYIDGETTITAQNMNDIQGAIVDLETETTSLEGYRVSKTITTGGNTESFTLISGKVYLLVVTKLNMNPSNTGYHGLYIVSAYTASGNNKTAIGTVLASSIVTVEVSSSNALILNVTSSNTNNVSVSLLQMN